MKKFLSGLGIGILIILLLIVGGLFYIGLIPGFAKPKDLGAKNDPTFVANFDLAHGMKNEIPGGVVVVGKQAEFSGQTNLDATFSGDDITSILNTWKSRSPALPIRNIQVRFNSDGTGEISGILEVKTAISVAKLLGYKDSDIETGKKYINYTAGDLPFYAKGIASVSNNKVSINASNFQIGKITVPNNITSAVAPIVSDAIERRLNQVGTIHVQTLDFSSGKLHFVGTVPDTIK